MSASQVLHQAYDEQAVQRILKRGQHNQEHLTVNGDEQRVVDKYLAEARRSRGISPHTTYPPEQQRIRLATKQIPLSHKVMDKEKELESDSRLLYPGFTEGDNHDRRADDRDSSVYLFPASEFEPNNDEEGEPGASSKPTNGELVRNKIVADMLDLIIGRAVPKSPPQQPQKGMSRQHFDPDRKPHELLSRDDIIRYALEEAHRDRGTIPGTRQLGVRLTTHGGQQLSLNKRPKVPPILNPSSDPDIRDLVARGRGQGYSEAALTQTRRESNRRRLIVPNKEEADTVDLWRLEQKYRQSITELKSYTK